ncbi:glycosyltransferase family 2 protein [Maricaulis maris]|nr:glycosyltransferase [Maricaulis maris]
MDMIINFFVWPDVTFPVTFLILASALFQDTLYAVLIAIAGVTLMRRRFEPNAHRLMRRIGQEAPRVSILAPAYNEAETVVDCTRALLRQNHSNYEVIVINDGSGDDTLNRLVRAFDLKPAERECSDRLDFTPVRAVYHRPGPVPLWVIDKVNGGKADALNAGIAHASGSLFCAIDADSLLEADALIRTSQPFLDNPDTVAVAGTVRVANGCRLREGAVEEAGLPRRFLPLVQSLEYLRAFLVARFALSELGALMIVSGAFGMFDRARVVEVGGYDPRTVGEDAELIVRLHRDGRDSDRPTVVRFIPEPVCWTQVPERLSDLAGQRRRWQRGALETLWRHRDAALRPGYGLPGTLGLGSMIVIDVIGPCLEVLGYALAFLLAATGHISWSWFAALFALVCSFGFLLSASAILLQEIELRRTASLKAIGQLLFAAAIENFGYRQLSNIWRLAGTIDFLKGSKHWGHIKRSAFDTTETPT